MCRSIVIPFLLVAVPLLAQPQYRNWFFGFGAGLDMAGATPSSLSGSTMQTDEGVACISDQNGQLLFYTNGETVYDRDHQPMPNGSGLFGSFSSSQSALIVPDPADSGRYYVFTTPAQLAAWVGGYNGLSWSLVDMDLNNGKGDVTIKNQELVPFVTEKLHATRHANGTDVWVVAHGWDNAEYYAYLVTCTGIEGPVVSTAGRPMLNDPGESYFAALGCMQFSAQGDRLASVWTHTNDDLSYEVRMDVLSFNNMTGVFSLEMSDDRIPGANDIVYAYGVCFSPDGQVLYRSDYGLLGGIAYSAILQYDLTAGDPMASEQEVAMSNSPAYGTLQRHGGSIYIARLDGAQYITRIAQPDVIGPGCGVVNAFASIAPAQGTWGLPNNWDTFPDPVPIDPIAIADTLVCGAATVVLEAVWEHPFHQPEFLWNNGDTTSTITVQESGAFTVEVILPCTPLYDTVHVTIDARALDLGPDLSICEGDSVMLSIDTKDVVSILWHNGSTDSIFFASQEELVRVEALRSNGCLVSDSLQVFTRNCLCPFFIPNAFTPDGDGINDEWGPQFDCELEGFHLALYDRWGKRLLETADPEDAWDGRVNGNALPATVLVYDLGYSWHDGRNLQHRERKGHVTLVR